MNEIMRKQAEYQLDLFEKDACSRSAVKSMKSVGELYDFIRDTQFYLNEEITEILESLGDGTRDIHKPWKQSNAWIRATFVRDVDTSKARSEAIDMLCFALNICIAVGLNEYNIDAEYDKVLDKNLRRLASEQ